MTGKIDFTWYGSDRRFREIVVTLSDDPQAPDLCQDEVSPLLQAINTFLAQIPGTDL